MKQSEKDKVTELVDEVLGVQVVLREIIYEISLADKEGKIQKQGLKQAIQCLEKFFLDNYRANDETEDLDL